jgi:AcrR family transcriptional regulator
MYDPARATRAALLDAALARFSAHGYDGASIRDITREAGANLGAVTYHFGSKEALFEAVVERALGPFTHAVADLAARTEPVLERIVRVARTATAFLAEYPEIPRLMVHSVILSDRPIPQAARAMVERYHAAVATLIRQGQRDGTIRAGDPRHLALGVISFPLWLAIARRPLREAIGIDQNDAATRARLNAVVAGFVRAALAAPSSRSRRR